jgi:hypothetical protein
MKKPKIFKDKMWGVYSKWGMHRAFQYKNDALAFVAKWDCHNMDIYYSIVKGTLLRGSVGSARKIKARIKQKAVSELTIEAVFCLKLSPLPPARRCFYYTKIPFERTPAARAAVMTVPCQ